MTAPVRTRRQCLAWLANQRRHSLSPEQIAALDAAVPGWRQGRGQNEARWNTTLEAVREFLSRTGRLPLESRWDTEEKRLAVWLAQARHQGDRLSEVRQRQLDSAVPGWRERRKKTWENSLTDTLSVVQLLGRVPTWTDTDTDAKAAYIWLKSNRKHPADHPLRVRLEQAIPGWSESAGSGWTKKLTLAIEYAAANGHLPGPNEKSCGVWLKSQREKASDAERAELDKALPGWNTTADEAWLKALDFVADYHERNGEHPSSASSDRAVKFHGRWLAAQRRSAASLAPHRVTALDERLPGWRQGVRKLGWQAKLDQRSDFAVKAGRLPSYGNPASSSERKLATWLHSQSTLGSPGQLDALDEQLPGWRQAALSPWEANLAECISYLQTHHRLPPQGRGASAFEKRLKGWINKQRASRNEVQQRRLDEHLPGWRGRGQKSRDDGDWAVRTHDLT